MFFSASQSRVIALFLLLFAGWLVIVSNVRSLRGEVESLRLDLETFTLGETSRNPGSLEAEPSLGEKLELARLRAEISSLRVQRDELLAKKNEPGFDLNEFSAPIPAESWAFVGNSTPETCLQTLFGVLDQISQGASQDQLLGGLEYPIVRIRSSRNLPEGVSILTEAAHSLFGDLGQVISYQIGYHSESEGSVKTLLVRLNYANGTAQTKKLDFSRDLLAGEHGGWMIDLLVQVRGQHVFISSE